MHLISPKGVAFQDVTVYVPERPRVHPKGWFTRLVFPYLKFMIEHYEVRCDVVVTWLEVSDAGDVAEYKGVWAPARGQETPEQAKE